MASSLLTKCLGNIDPMAIGRPSFAGRRKRHYSETFKVYLKTGKASSSFSSDPTQLQFSLKKLKDEIVTSIDKGTLNQVRTTEWYKRSGNGIAPCDFEAVETGSYFYKS